MNKDKAYVNKQYGHFRTRAVGQLWMGPLQQTGYDNRVLELTLNEMEFRNSREVDRFLDYKRRKFATNRQLCRGKKLQYVSQGDEF